jgi:hypothetical protein
LVLLLVILITISVESAGLVVFLSEPLHSLGFSCCWRSVENFSVFFHELLDQVLVLDNLRIFLEQELAMLAQDLMASLALQWHVWELFAHDAANLVHKFFL